MRRNDTYFFSNVRLSYTPHVVYVVFSLILGLNVHFFHYRLPYKILQFSLSMFPAIDMVLHLNNYIIYSQMKQLNILNEARKYIFRLNNTF